ncbi:SgcJ/EcaC family oxidoreductase [Streptomyces guryensis]|uniref:SgcJ/EcaC family oxidoreductase n=1 Tax=Streptomyces guryensis TaxID=2886947 RepID=A0A9Q3VNF5_9ACTN|nr:SgcJ/EcaC family oxidoreductase [Streptomyces guryensis]MCD9874892.1 SgcJ/EcaC family oxidoreductase [Streptomyces guryensis]
MKYMLLVCGDDTADASGMAPVEPWVEELGDRSVRLHGHRLALPSEAVTVRVRGGEVLRTDGPFAETKEYVAGFDVLECDSLEEAVEAAARHPVATIGAMEVRPFWPMWDEEDEETSVRRLDAELTEAARERDVERILACYAPDVEIFHLADGGERQGLDAFRKAVEDGFATVTGPVTREVLELRIHADESIAFAHALVRTRATRTDGTHLDDVLRVTTGYRNAGLRWLITHEHVSPVPDAHPAKDRP